MLLVIENPTDIKCGTVDSEASEVLHVEIKMGFGE